MSGDAHEDRSLLLLAANSEVIAYRRTDGHVAWRQKFQGTLLGMPVTFGGAMELAVHGSRVYVGARDRIVCLDYATGVIVGQVTLPDTVRRPCFLLDGEHLYVVGRDRVLCFTLQGQTVWQSPHGLLLQDGPTLALPGNVRHGDDIGEP